MEIYTFYFNKLYWCGRQSYVNR